jgi:hypothetical protein
MKKLLSEKNKVIGLVALAFGLIFVGLYLREYHNSSYGLIGLGFLLFMFLRFR